MIDRYLNKLCFPSSLQFTLYYFPTRFFLPPLKETSVLKITMTRNVVIQ